MCLSKMGHKNRGKWNEKSIRLQQLKRKLSLVFTRFFHVKLYLMVLLTLFYIFHKSSPVKRTKINDKGQLEKQEYEFLQYE